MIIKSIQLMKKNIFDRSQSLYHLGRDIIEAGVKVYNNRNAQVTSETKPEPREILSRNLQKNLLTREVDDSKEQAKLSSFKSHKIKVHPVSGENWNSNMIQKNFSNHQGN